MAGFGLPKYLAAPLGVALPLVELAVGIALIPAATAHWGALGALILLAVFVAGIANVMVRGREAECHCFGQLHSSRATPSAVLVSKEGLIASPVVQGAASIRVMITSATSPSDVTGIVREHENGESWREGHAVSMPAMGLDAS